MSRQVNRTSQQVDGMQVRKRCPRCAAFFPGCVAGEVQLCDLCHVPLVPVVGQVVSVGLLRDVPDSELAVRQARSYAAIQMEKAVKASGEAREAKHELPMLREEITRQLESATWSMSASEREGKWVLAKFLEVWEGKCGCEECRAERSFGITHPDGIYWEKISRHLPHMKPRSVIRRLNELSRPHGNPCNTRHPTRPGYCSLEIYHLPYPPLKWTRDQHGRPSGRYLPATKPPSGASVGDP